MKLLRAVAPILVILAVTPPARAQDALPRGNLSGFGVFAVNAADGLDRGHGFGVSGALFFSPMLGVEGGYRRQMFDVTGTDANAVSGGELAANVITVNVVARFTRSAIQPYVTGGVAFLSNDYTIDPTLGQELAEFNFTAEESFDSTIGFNIGGGVDFQVSRSIGFFAEGRFLAATTDTTAGLIDDISGVEATTTGSQDLNVFTIAGGVRILF